MNRERAKELLPILEAYANGEDIQFHDVIGWSDIGDEGIDPEGLDDDGLKFRIKPDKPREFWIDPQNALASYMVPAPDEDWVLVREVIE